MHPPKRDIIRHKTGDSQDGAVCFLRRTRWHWIRSWLELLRRQRERHISPIFEKPKIRSRVQHLCRCRSSPSTSHHRAFETDGVMAVGNRKDLDQDKNDVSDDDTDHDNDHERTEQQNLRSHDNHVSDNYNYSYGDDDSEDDDDDDDDDSINEGSQFLRQPQVAPFESDTTPKRFLSDRCSKQSHTALPERRKRQFSNSSHCYQSSSNTNRSTSVVGSDVDIECEEFSASLKIKTVELLKMFFTFSFHQLSLPGNPQSQQTEVVINDVVKAPNQVPISEPALLPQFKRRRWTFMKNVLLIDLKKQRSFHEERSYYAKKGAKCRIMFLNEAN